MEIESHLLIYKVENKCVGFFFNAQALSNKKLLSSKPQN